MTEIEKLRKEIETLDERWDIETDDPGWEGIQAEIDIGRLIIKAQQHLSVRLDALEGNPNAEVP